LVIYLYIVVSLMLGLKWQQWAALASGFMVMLVQGSLYVYGTMSPYLFSYLYYEGASHKTQVKPISKLASSPSSTP
jgi:hypothetical protein